VEDTTTLIADALDQVGPRLKQLRQQRGVTLTSLAASTGISKSTLSRLETGHRRPSLELLLPWRTPTGSPSTNSWERRRSATPGSG